VDIVPVDVSDKFSLASPTHLVLFLEDIYVQINPIRPRALNGYAHRFHTKISKQA